MNRAHRHATGTPQLSPLIAATLGLGVLIVLIGDAAAQLGARLDGHRPPPIAPLSLALELADGTTRWPGAATAIVAIAYGVLAVAAAALLTWRSRSGSRRSHADRAAPMMGRGHDIHPVSQQNARATAERFSIEQEGLPIARAVSDGQPLFATWEDQQCDIWGPRRGKTATRAIPTLLAAPAAAFATSNKPDLYAATRLVREQSGQVWNFDPEHLTGGQPCWWWNPLSYVTSDRRALELTDAFVGAYRDPDARPDPFFDPAGQELVANLLQAAALDHHRISPPRMSALGHSLPICLVSTSRDVRSSPKADIISGEAL